MKIRGKHAVNKQLDMKPPVKRNIPINRNRRRPHQLKTCNLYFPRNWDASATNYYFKFQNISGIESDGGSTNYYTPAYQLFYTMYGFSPNGYYNDASAGFGAGSCNVQWYHNGALLGTSAQQYESPGDVIIPDGGSIELMVQLAGSTNCNPSGHVFDWGDWNANLQNVMVMYGGFQAGNWQDVCTSPRNI